MLTFNFTDMQSDWARIKTSLQYHVVLSLLSVNECPLKFVPNVNNTVHSEQLPNSPLPPAMTEGCLQNMYGGNEVEDFPREYTRTEFCFEALHCKKFEEYLPQESGSL